MYLPPHLCQSDEWHKFLHMRFNFSDGLQNLQDFFVGREGMIAGLVTELSQLY